jgi:hypothetical protein
VERDHPCFRITEDDRRGNFASKQLLKIRVEQFINYFNATMARPFHWT